MRACSAIGIIVVRAVIFRPFHRWLGEAIEATVRRRRREARTALLHVRNELSSFDNVQQVLRAVVEGVDRHMGTGGSAIYLRRGSYAVEASTFNVAATRVESDDPLVVRLQSPGPADPRALGSAALGELAFAMTAGGGLVGFLTLASKHVEIDAEDRFILGELSEAAGAALLALDPRLLVRGADRRSAVSHNLPRQTTSFVGRQAEVSAVCELVRKHAIVTIVGAGGMGKTRLGLQAAAALLGERTEGAWFVDLTPIDDSLVESRILSELGSDQSRDSAPLERIVELLATRAMVLVIDGFARSTAGAARVVDAIAKRCPNVNVLGTSREPLGLADETVHQLCPLDDESAMQLFSERARAVDGSFDLSGTSGATITTFCAHLGGMPLAIELAAARAGHVPVAELSRGLQLRALRNAGSEPPARDHAAYGLIDWSFNLLTPIEQQCFARLSPFVGGISLDRAMAVWCRDELQLPDALASLAGKSLLAADAAETTPRYRFLEPIREYARARLERDEGAGDVLLRFAQTFADFADAAYEEFEAGPNDDWLERNRRELDNVRAALHWSLDEGDEPQLGARIAGGFGVVFLRLTLLQEGIDWCQRVLARDAELRPALEARLQYVLSMLHNSQGHFSASLSAARRALVQYRAAEDRRGVVRALAQIAQQLENDGQSGDALFTAEEAVDVARRQGDRGVLAMALGRWGNALGPDRIDEARTRYSEATELLGELDRDGDRSRILLWWADGEYRAGNFERAASLAEEALPKAPADVRIGGSLTAASIYWALEDQERAIPATRKALELASEQPDGIYLLWALSWAVMLPLEADADEAARLFGYAEQQRRHAGWTSDEFEQRAWGTAENTLREKLGSERCPALFAEGAAWDRERALTVAAKY